MRVLVTGAGGFLGRHLVDGFRAAGHDVVAAGHDAEWPVDFRLPVLVAELFREARPERIVHLAGSATPIEAGAPSDVQTENVVHPLLNVLDFAGGRPVLHVSSAEVYGSAPPDEAGPVRPMTLHAAARASAEALGLRRAAKGGTPLSIVRPCVVLGPGLSPRSEIGGWLARTGAGATEVPTLDLSRVRDLLDVHDLVSAFCVLIERGAAGTVYNLSADRSLALETVFARLCPHARAVPAGAAREPARLEPVSARLAALGWAPTRTIEQTLASVSLRPRERRR